MGSVRRVKVRELQARASELISAAEAGAHVVIERYNQPAAALIGIQDLQRLRGQEGRKVKRIAFSNISGGETKTTLTMNLAAWYARQGLRIGVIDLDPQASLTKFLGLHLDPDSPAWEPTATVLGVLQGRSALPTPISVHGFDVWPANEHLNDAIAKLMQGTGFMNLRRATEDLPYDALLLDTMPGMGPLLVASLATADHVVVPVNSIKGLQNLEPLANVLSEARAWSPDLGVRMFVPSGLQANLNYHKRVVESLAEYGALAPLGPRIREANRLIGLQSMQHRPAVLIEPSSAYTQDIAEFAHQLAAMTGLVVPEQVIG